MSHYAERYGTDWEEVDRDEATERAYALGVAERLGERDRDELKRLYEAAGTNYAKSLVEVAFQEGRQEAGEVVNDGDHGEVDPWAQLIEGESVVFDPRDRFGGRDGVPEALDSGDHLDRPNVDSTDATDRPKFLDR